MKFFVAIGGLLLLVLAVLAVAPRFVDWTQYRAEFEAEATRLLGEPVAVRGSASARLLPFPSVSFGDVVVGDPAAPLLTVRDFRMDAELAPFLSGEIRIFDMRLDAPRLRVEIGPDGTIAGPSAVAAAGVVLERVAVANGAAVLLDRRTGRQASLSDIDGTFSARSLQGPFQGEGSLFLLGEPMRFTANGGVSTPEGRFPLRLGVVSTRTDFAAQAELLVSSGHTAPILEGPVRVSTRPPDGGSGAAQPLLPVFQLGGDLKLDRTVLAVENLRGEFGAGEEEPYRASGRATLALGSAPSFTLDVAGEDIDLGEVAPPAGTGATLQGRLEAARAALSRLPVPTIPGEVRIALPLARFGDTPVRGFEFNGAPTEAGWRVERFAAEFPGRTLVEASGDAALRGEPGFAGHLLVAVRQPAAFAAWAGLAGEGPLAALDRAGLSARVDLSPARQSLADLELDLGGQTVRGSAERFLAADGITTRADVAAADLEMEPFVALARAALLGSGVQPGAERFELQFDAAPVSFAGYRVGRLGIDATLDRGLLDISNATAEDFAGTDLHAEGTVSDLLTTPAPDLSLDIEAENPERFVDFLEGKLPGSPLLRSLRRTAQTLGPLDLHGTAATVRDAGSPVLRVDLGGRAQGTEVSVALALENGLAATTVNGSFGLDLTLANADPSVLLDQLGIASAPIGAPGPLRLEAGLTGHPNQPTVVSATLRAPGSTLGANGTTTLDASGLRGFEGRVDLRSEDATPWLTTLGVAAGQPVTGLPVALAGTVIWRDGDWRLQAITGEVTDSVVGLDLGRQPGGPVAGRVEVADLSAEWLETVLLGRVPSGEGENAFRDSLLPETPFRIDVALGGISGTTYPLNDLRATLDSRDGTLRVEGLDAAFGDGRIRGAGQFANVGGLVTFSGEGTAQNWALRNPRLTALLDGALRVEGGGRDAQALRLALVGNGTATLRDGVLLGLAADPMPAVLAAADGGDGTADTEAVRAVVDRAGADAAVPLPALNLGLSLGSGELRVAPFETRFGESRLTGDATISLNDGALSGVLRLVPARPGETLRIDAPAPTIPFALGGSLAAPEISADPAPLVSYLAARAYAIETARVEALEEDLRETVRLRREARFYRERADQRERLREERLAREAAAEAEREATERRLQEEAERQRRDEERRRTETAASEAAQASGSAGSRALDFEAVVPEPPVRPAAPAAPTGFEGLPGVAAPAPF